MVSKSTQKKQVREAGDRLQIAFVATAIFVIVGALYSLTLGTFEEFLSLIYLDRINMGGMETNFIFVSAIIFVIAFAASYVVDAMR